MSEFIQLYFSGFSLGLLPALLLGLVKACLNGISEAGDVLSP